MVAAGEPVPAERRTPRAACGHAGRAGRQRGRARTIRWAIRGAAWLALGLAGVQPPPVAASEPAAPWWSHALIYEIYPRSFADSDGDGVGDLNGITEHLDYLKSLGVDAIWIAPFFPSPQVDFGYDIADYAAIDPQYGTLADFDRLMAACRARGIRVILDMVMNHTSDQHPWFRESAGSRTNPKADWYVWSDGIPENTPGISAAQRAAAHGGRVPPNNWISSPGSSWEWVEARGQWYYHHFFRQQPDLNWRNPAVERAVFRDIRFWLDRGVSGFRLDAITTLVEERGLRDQPVTGTTNAQGDPNLKLVYTDDQPEDRAIVRRLRRMVDRYPGHPVLIGETYLPDTAALARWYGPLHLPMDLFIGFGGARYTADHFRRTLGDAETRLPGPPLIVFDNHDHPRSIDRFGDGAHDILIAKGLAAALLMPRGVALTYYGAPIAMRTATPTRREDVRDPTGLSGWPRNKGRDGERTPMQWTAGPQAGFSTAATTWLPVQPDHVAANVATESADPASPLSWWRALAALRRSEPALREGRTEFLDRANPDVFSFRRARRGVPAVYVAINMSAQPRNVVLASGTARTLASTSPSSPQVRLSRLELMPYQTWIGRAR